MRAARRRLNFRCLRLGGCHVAPPPAAVAVLRVCGERLRWSRALRALRLDASRWLAWRFSPLQVKWLDLKEDFGLHLLRALVTSAFDSLFHTVIATS